MKEIQKEALFNSTDQNYLQLLDEAKQKIITTRIQVASTISRSQFELYWWFGQRIIESQEKHG